MEVQGASWIVANWKENPMFWMMAAILTLLWLLESVIGKRREGHSPPADGGPHPGAHRDR